MDHALRNLKVSLDMAFIDSLSIMLLDLLYKLWCSNSVWTCLWTCFLLLATLSTLSSDASNSRWILWTNDRATFKNWKISKSLWFACIATIIASFHFLSQLIVLHLKRKKIKKFVAKTWQAHMYECPQISDALYVHFELASLIVYQLFFMIYC